MSESQFDRAIDAYQSVSRQSRYFVDALFEQSWTYIKAKEWKKAYRALDLLLLTSPDNKDGPELRLLMGNLNLRMENFHLASDAFSKARDEFEPIHRQLQSELVRAKQDPGYFDKLVGKNLDKFDIGSFIPASATRWVQADPDVARMLTLTNDVGEIQRALKDSEQIVTKLERAIQTSGKAGIFPDLAAARTKSIEVTNQLVETRQKFVARVRAVLESSLTPEEKRELDRTAAERDGLERRIKNLPLTRQALKAREHQAREEFTKLDGKGSELNVEIQSLQAQLVAIEQYYRNSRTEQKIRPEDIEGPVKDLRAAIEELHTAHDKVRDEIAEASRESATAGAAGEEERQMATRLAQLLKQEQGIQGRAKYRLPVTSKFRSTGKQACWRAQTSSTPSYANWTSASTPRPKSDWRRCGAISPRKRKSCGKPVTSWVRWWVNRSLLAAVWLRRCSARWPTASTTSWFVRTWASSTSPGG